MRNINNPYSSDYTHNKSNINNPYPDISNLPLSQSNFVIQPTNSTTNQQQYIASNFANTLFQTPPQQYTSPPQPQYGQQQPQYAQYGQQPQYTPQQQYGQQQGMSNLQKNIYPQITQTLTNPSLAIIYGWLEQQAKNDKNTQTKYIQQIGLSKIDNIKQEQQSDESHYKKYPLYQSPTVNQFPSPFIKYKIIPYMDQKKALDVCSVNDKKRAYKMNSLIIWDYHGGPNQLFYILPINSQSCYLINIAKGFTAQVSANDRQQEANLVANVRKSRPNQLWKLVPSTTFFGCFEIVSGDSKLAMDLNKEQCENGTKVIQYRRTGKKNQQWRIVPS